MLLKMIILNDDNKAILIFIRFCFWCLRVKKYGCIDCRFRLILGLKQYFSIPIQTYYEVPFQFNSIQFQICSGAPLLQKVQCTLYTKRP